jgi:hypothetical protein
LETTPGYQLPKTSAFSIRKKPSTYTPTGSWFKPNACADQYYTNEYDANGDFIFVNKTVNFKYPNSENAFADNENLVLCWESEKGKGLYTIWGGA